MRFLATLILAVFILGCQGEQRQSQGESRPFLGSEMSPFGIRKQPPRKREVHPDTYHVVVFSYHNFGWRIKMRDCHTYATWVKTRNKHVVEQVDISWGPRDRANIGVAINQVPGMNKPIGSTMTDAQGHKIAYWILRTDKTFYDAALIQSVSLKNYVVLDNRTRPEAVNCIHACSDVAGHLETGTLFGIPAGQAVANFFLQTGKAWSCEDKWVIASINRANNCNIP